MIRIIAGCLLSAILFSCSSGSLPAKVLAPEKMKAVLWDYIKAESFTNEFIGKDSTKNLALENVKLQKAIFAKHHVTREEFYTSYYYYQDHPNQMQVLLDSMIVETRRKYDAHLVDSKKQLLP
jgi:hypothetical protein